MSNGWDEVMVWHLRDLEERLRSALTYVPLPTGESKLANDLSEEEVFSLDPEVSRAVVDMIFESIEADNGMVVLLVGDEEKLKRVDLLEESDLPHLAAYMEQEEQHRREFAEACGELATFWGGLRDIDRFEGKKLSPDETLEERFFGRRAVGEDGGEGSSD